MGHHPQPERFCPTTSKIHHPDEELEVIDRSSTEHEPGTPIARRSVLTVLALAGLLTPLVGTGTALAAEDTWYPIPEESGSIPWW
jgi:hypothetical protein